MARKTSSVPTRIWGFGALAPKLESDRTMIQDQLWKANRYYNQLIDIERQRRIAFREARSRLVPTLAALEQKNDVLQEALEKARQDLRNLRQKDRQRTEAPGLKSQIANLVREARALSTDLKAERKAISEATKEAQERLAELIDPKTPRKRIAALKVLLQGTSNTLLEFARIQTKLMEDSYQAGRDARKACEVYWGTYLLVEEAAKVACKSLTDPRFKRFDGGGRIGVQIQGGIPTDKLFSSRDSGGSTLMQIDPLPEDQWDTRSGRRHARTQVRIRVGSIKKLTPVWAEFPVLIHRNLPPGIVKNAWILVRRVGTDTRYELQLMIESVLFDKKARGTGVVALDVGWRVLPNGNLRVAYWVDDKGRHGSMELPERLRTGIALPSTLRGFNDVHFEAAKKVLRDWLATESAAIPEWLPEACQNIAQWRQARRLAAIAFRLASESTTAIDYLWGEWKRERQTKRMDLFAPFGEIQRWLRVHEVRSKAAQIRVYLDFWRKKNKHLLNWECNQREQALACRKQLYNTWANHLASTYDKIIIEDFDLRRSARRAKPEEDDEIFQAVRHNRQVAAVGEYRLAIKERVEPDRLILKSSLNSTITCRPCRHIENFDKLAELVHTCPACGRTWDQDRNAAENLLFDFQTNGSEYNGEPPVVPQLPVPLAKKKAKPRPKQKKETRLPARA